MNFNTVRSRITKAGKDASDEMRKINEIRQLNVRVNEEKKKINSLYLEIGKKLYDQYKQEPLESFEKEFRSIGESFNEIEKLEAKIRKTKGVRLCPNCSAEVNIGEKFCSNCGCRLPEIFAKSDDNSEGNPEDEVWEETESEPEEGSAEETEAEPESEESAEETEAEPEPEEGSAEETEAEPESEEGSAEETEEKSKPEEGSAEEKF